MSFLNSQFCTESPACKPKAIIFDLLTALLDSWTLWDTSVPPGSSCDGRTWRARYLDITFKQGVYAPYDALVRQSAHDVGLPLVAAENLLQHWQQLKPWPEVSAVLLRLRRMNVKLAVVTNCSDVLGRQAVTMLCNTIKAQTGEMFSFDAVMTAEESGFYKPRREAYDAGLEALGLVAEDVLFVAGSAGDMEGAKSAGMRVVWNNHVGLSRKGQIEPLKEGKTLDEALDGVVFG